MACKPIPRFQTSMVPRHDNKSNACTTDWVTDNDDMHQHTQSLANDCISDQHPVMSRACPADLKSAIRKYEPCAGRMLNPIFCSRPAKYFRFCSRECPKDLNNRGSRLRLLMSEFGLRESVHERPIITSLVNPTILSAVADMTHSRWKPQV